LEIFRPQHSAFQHFREYSVTITPLRAMLTFQKIKLQLGNLDANAGTVILKNAADVRGSGMVSDSYRKVVAYRLAWLRMSVIRSYG
jgi:hypothetical protein